MVSDRENIVIDRVEGFVEHLNSLVAHVILFVEDKTERDFLPRDVFDRWGIGEGDSFWYDPVTGDITAPDPVPVEWPEKYDSPDELSARAGRGP